MDDEIRAFEKNETSVLQKLPHGNKALRSKWVYKIKHHSDESYRTVESKTCHLRTSLERGHRL